MSEELHGRPHVSDWRRLARDSDDTSDRDDEGLRERKKRLTHQQISDTATVMFLERGFDAVKVTDVAAACDVSEKTIYNYFPTKESLVLDREDEMAGAIRRALGPGAQKVSPVEAMVQILKSQLDDLIRYWVDADLKDMTEIRRFTELVESTPSLRAARMDMMHRLSYVAAEAMATRAGVDPSDPEPQIAADSLLGLWRLYFAAIVRFSDEDHSPNEVRDEVMAVVRRAARLIDTGLWSFGMAVQGANGREQIKAAAESADQARKQVIVAMKQARETWHSIKADFKDQSREERDALKGIKSATQQQIRQAAHELKREVHASKQDLMRARRDAMRDRERARRADTPRPPRPPRKRPS